MQARNENNILTIRNITRAAILTAVAVVLQYLEVMLPFLPGFLKLDFSLLPSLIAGYTLGPVIGIITIAIKDVIHLFVTTSAGIGELADFLISSAFLLPSVLIYNANKTNKSMIFGLITGTIFLVLTAILCNIYIILPLYFSMFGGEAAVWGATGKDNISSLSTYIIYAALPFNLLKGVLISLAGWLINAKLLRALSGISRGSNKKFER